MREITDFLNQYLFVVVESTTNFQAWIPVLIEMKTKNINIEVYSLVSFNEDYSNLLIGTVNQSEYNIQINATVQEFENYLDFFKTRSSDGDIISVWISVVELENLIDKNSEPYDITQQSGKVIEKGTITENVPDEIKISNPEDLAAEIISFAKTEFPDLDDEIWISTHRISNEFWRRKNIKKWDLPLDLQLTIEKAERLAQKQLVGERSVRENEKLLLLCDPCANWAKEQGLKKVTEANIDAFLLERNISDLPRTKKRALFALVNVKLDKEKPDILSVVNLCVNWARELGLSKVTENNVDDFLLERNIEISPRAKKRELLSKINGILVAK